MPTLSKTTSDMMSPAASGHHLSKLEKWWEMPNLMAFSRICSERFKRGSHNFTESSGTVSPTNLPDMTSLAASDRLQNAVK